MTAPRCIALTGLHRGESPQPGGAVAESLRLRFPDLRIVGLCYDPMESGLFSPAGDRLDAAHLMPFPGAGPDALLDRLRDLVARERIGAVIPCLDSELRNYIAIAGDLAAMGVRTLLPEPDPLEQRSKTGLLALCQSLGVPTPRAAHADDPVTLAGHALRIGYPCYVKGRLYDAHRAEHAGELHAAFHEIAKVWGTPVIVQEAIMGEEYDVAGIGDGKGGLTAFCTIRKMLRSRLGKGYGGVVVDNPGLEASARRIVAALKWNGPFELEFVKAPGRPPMLMEMNPRFPAWIDFPSKLGCNMPAAILERLFGDAPTPLPRCEAGKIFVRHCTDLVGDIGDLARITADGVAEAVP